MNKIRTLSILALLIPFAMSCSISTDTSVDSSSIDENGDTYEYVDIFKGRKEGTYVGEYIIKYIECLQRDY